MKFAVPTSFAFALLLAISPIAKAASEENILLSAEDYVFLAAQGIEPNNTILQKMSPKELHRLHYIINDKRTESNPQSRARASMKALAEFEGNQRWETDNPGHLWDEKKPQVPSGARPN